MGNCFLEHGIHTDVFYKLFYVNLCIHIIVYICVYMICVLGNELFDYRMIMHFWIQIEC